MNEQGDTLRRAMDALNSVCMDPRRKEEMPGPEIKLPTPLQTSPTNSDLGVAGRVAEPESIPPHDPAEWRDAFALWLDSACVRSTRCFGGVPCLHIAFCEWEAGQGGVPCNRDTFERLLSERGFLVGEVSGVMLVSGLTLREDFEVYQCVTSDCRTHPQMQRD